MDGQRGHEPGEECDEEELVNRDEDGERETTILHGSYSKGLRTSDYEVMILGMNRR